MNLITNSAAETQNLGAQLGKMLSVGDIVCFGGDLGAGKTTFAQGIGQGWGVATPLTSPTFVIVRRYQRLDGQFLHHLDAYRLSSGADVESIGLDDILDMKGAVLIEWAENIEDDLPQDTLWIDIHPTDIDQPEQRQIQIRANGIQSQILLDQLRSLYAAGN